MRGTSDLNVQGLLHGQEIEFSRLFANIDTQSKYHERIDGELAKTSRLLVLNLPKNNIEMKLAMVLFYHIQ